MKAQKYLKLIKFDHWIKNLLVFAPLFFSLQFSSENFAKSLFAFLSFSLIASSVYIINDLFDIESDRKHFRKKLRPLALGEVGKKEVLVVFFILFFAGLAIAFTIPNNFFYIIVSYFLLNILYSKWLKKIPIIDVMVIAAGFVLRIMAGASAILVAVSHWIIVCTFFGALLLGFGKRKNEIDIFKEKSSRYRNVLLSYEKNFLNQLIGLTSGITIISYLLYTMDSETIKHFNTQNLLYTVPFVVFGVFRYFQIIYTTSSGEDPTKIFVKDRSMRFNLLLWGSIFGIIVYFSLF